MDPLNSNSRPATITQRELPLRIPLWVPTLTLAGARGSLGVSEDEVRAMIDAAEIPWAWNIATREAKRVELRILAACLPAVSGSGQRAPIMKFDQVVRLVLGAKRPFIWGTNLYRALNCDSGHLMNLVREHSLEILPNHCPPDLAGGFTKDELTRGQSPGWRRGPGGSPCITWNSAVEFLKERKVSP